MSLREQSFLILTAIVEQPRHGYGILRQVATLSGGAVKLQAGTLYTALDRLRDEGLVTVDREEVVDGRLRRYYRITDHGAGVLAAEVQRLERNAATARGSLSSAGFPVPKLSRLATAHRPGPAVPA
jgi:DNA-binding PadR family transcriptional regulator